SAVSFCCIFSSRRRHTSSKRDWSSDVCSSDLQSNPLGRSGLPAPGENAAIDQGLITAPLPAVTGAERDRFAGRHVLVVGAGHSRSEERRVGKEGRWWWWLVGH